MNTTEAANLARIILADSEADRPMDLYTLNVHEARTLARAALAATRAYEFAGLLDAEAARSGSRDGAFTARTFASTIRAVLDGEPA